MELLMQFAIIAAVYFTGEIIAAIIPLPIPATVYGLVLLFICLCTGVIKLRHVEKAGDFLLAIMPIMFVPGAAAALEHLDILKEYWLQIVLISGITTFTTLIITGYAAKFTEKFLLSGRRRAKK